MNTKKELQPMTPFYIDNHVINQLELSLKWLNFKEADIDNEEEQPLCCDDDYFYDETFEEWRCRNGK